ncbi:hypothetical protein ACQPYK_22855 [Streptosporangium sp. CA-135522]|uniref:hypothetical protein n=1 Tax=Streptosporangium sp. CA-135522 TaxID=3240072 RepID=UPI003D93129A
MRLTLEEGPALDVATLDQALTGDRTELWTGATADRGEPFDSMHLWVATTDDRFGMIWQDPDRDWRTHPTPTFTLYPAEARAPTP